MENYILKLRRSWMQQDGMALAILMSLRQHWYPQMQDLSSPSIKHLPMPLDDLATSHLRTLYSLSQGDLLQAYSQHSMSVTVLIRILQIQKEENWMLPVMNTMCLELRLLAVKIEKSSDIKNVKPSETLEKCADCLMSCFRICAADNRSSEDETKRWGMLALVNQMLKVYFKINKLHLCKPLIRAIESSPFKDQFPLAQQITYKFFVGRKAMFDSDYKSADEYLTYAFEHCHRLSVRNKRLILLYLIPVKMLRGFMPKPYILKKYNLTEFWELIEAVKKGDIRTLDSVMIKHDKFLINAGIFLIVEKLKLTAYRNLFKKVHLIMNNHQLGIEYLHLALKLHYRDDIDMDETECIVANLIYEGKIKGYISHQHKKLVISKQNPFPRLSTLV